jgi:lipopolysaccharide/colanic/teichoic acid biosynthesis glycosyltransferase
MDAKTRLELIDRLEEIEGKRSRRCYMWKVTAWEMTLGLAYFMKRLFDIVSATPLLIALSPVFLLTAFAIYLDNPGPVFYVQTRVGKDGRHFSFYKFRSMIVGADKMKDQLQEMNESGDGVIFKMKEDPRITRIGQIIRKFSIDELPQLINVLRGDMSLVGPRPALPKEVALYTLEQRKRLHIKPGITCIWQVSGRSDIPFSGQVQLDLDYIRSNSLFKDIWILLKTIPAVITGKGAY